MDFTLRTFHILLNSLQINGHRFISVSDYFKTGNNFQKEIILRHDVDACPRNSLATAQMEHTPGIRGTYYFRMDIPFVEVVYDIGWGIVHKSREGRHEGDQPKDQEDSLQSGRQHVVDDVWKDLFKVNLPFPGFQQ